MLHILILVFLSVNAAFAGDYSSNSKEDFPSSEIEAVSSELSNYTDDYASSSHSNSEYAAEGAEQDRSLYFANLYDPNNDAQIRALRRAAINNNSEIIEIPIRDNHVDFEGSFNIHKNSAKLPILNLINLFNNSRLTKYAVVASISFICGMSILVIYNAFNVCSKEYRWRYGSEMCDMYTYIRTSGEATFMGILLHFILDKSSDIIENLIKNTEELPYELSNYTDDYTSSSESDSEYAAEGTEQDRSLYFANLYDPNNDAQIRALRRAALDNDHGIIEIPIRDNHVDFEEPFNVHKNSAKLPIRLEKYKQCELLSFVFSLFVETLIPIDITICLIVLFVCFN